MNPGLLNHILDDEHRSQRAITGGTLLCHCLKNSRWSGEHGVKHALQGKGAVIQQENTAYHARHSINGRGVQNFDEVSLIAHFRAWQDHQSVSVKEASPQEQGVLWLTRRETLQGFFALDSGLRELVEQLTSGGCDHPYFASFFAKGAVAGLGVGRLLIRLPADQELLSRDQEISRHLPLLLRALKTRQRYLLSGKAGCGKSTFLQHLVSHTLRHLEKRRGETHQFLLLSPADFSSDRSTCTAALTRLTDKCQKNPNLVLVWDDFDRFVRHPFLHELLLEHFWTRFRGALHPIVVCGVYEEMSMSPLVEKVRPAELTSLSVEATTELVGQRLKQLAGKDAEVGGMAAQLVALCGEHYHGQALPGAALALLEGGIQIAKAREDTSLSVEDIQTFVATDLGLSPEVFGKDKRVFYRELRKHLEGEVFGQGHVIQSLCEQLYRRALRPHAELPRGRFLFVGPPGTGKTQLAKSLAHHLGYGQHAFYLFSMAEYANDGARTRFIGSDPGYVGFKSTFTVFDAVSKTPACVILLDEIDRAHATIQDVLLGMLEGSARDGSGQLHRFSQAVFIMTTNLGQELVEGRFKDRLKPTPEAPAERSSWGDEERARWGGALADPDLRKALLERSAPRKDEVDLQPLLMQRRRSLEVHLQELLEYPAVTPESEAKRDAQTDAALHSLGLVSSVLSSVEHLSGRHALDRAFLDRIDFLFPFLPLERRHLQCILEKHIRAENVDPQSVDTQQILDHASRESEAGRAVLRIWAEYRGRSLAADLWEPALR
jgi:MoxR-like ATPase